MISDRVYHPAVRTCSSILRLSWITGARHTLGIRYDRPGPWAGPVGFAALRKLGGGRRPRTPSYIIDSIEKTRNLLRVSYEEHHERATKSRCVLRLSLPIRLSRFCLVEQRGTGTG